MKSIEIEVPLVEEVDYEPTLVIPNEKPTLEKFIESGFVENMLCQKTDGHAHAFPQCHNLLKNSEFTSCISFIGWNCSCDSHCHTVSSFPIVIASINSQITCCTSPSKYLCLGICVDYRMATKGLNRLQQNSRSSEMSYQRQRQSNNSVKEVLTGIK